MSYRLIAVAGIEIASYGIPPGSLRGTYNIHLDEAFVDRRCLKRYRRKWVREMRRRHGKNFHTRLRVR